MEVSQLGLAIFCIAAIVEGMIFGIAYDAFSVIICTGGRSFESNFQKKLQSIELPLIGKNLLFKKKAKQTDTNDIVVCLRPCVYAVRRNFRVCACVPLQRR